MNATTTTTTTTKAKRMTKTERDALVARANRAYEAHVMILDDLSKCSRLANPVGYADRVREEQRCHDVCQMLAAQLKRSR